MIEKPNLADEKITAALYENYDLTVTDLEFLPLGNDTNAWAFKVAAADNNTYFLKVRRGEVNEPSLVVPRYLKDHGIPQVLAPLPTRAGTLRATVDNFALILYPFIEGESGGKAGFSDAQFIEYGKILRQIHDVPLTPEFARSLRKETFLLKWLNIVQSFPANFLPIKNDFEQAFAAFWQEKRDEIEKLVERTLQLSHMLQSQSLEFVLCHADIHKYNILVDHDGKLFVVDWDETIYAPKERDLMHIASANTRLNERTKEVELFYRGYGETEVNPIALTFYRYAWAVEEMGSFAERVFLIPDSGDATRQKAVDLFRSLFQPGNVVEVAYGTEANLRDTTI